MFQACKEGMGWDGMGWNWAGWNWHNRASERAIAISKTYSITLMNNDIHFCSRHKSF